LGGAASDSRAAKLVADQPAAGNPAEPCEIRDTELLHLAVLARRNTIVQMTSTLEDDGSLVVLWENSVLDAMRRCRPNSHPDPPKYHPDRAIDASLLNAGYENPVDVCF
jgi:hypothetical protein